MTQPTALNQKSRIQDTSAALVFKLIWHAIPTLFNFLH